MKDKILKRMHKQKENKWKILKKNKSLLIMCLPAIVKIFIFSYIPMIGLIIVFKNYRAADGIFGSTWNGFKNFEFFFKSTDAKRVITNTLLLNTLCIVIGTLASIAFALMLYEITSRKILKVYQSILFFPYFFSWVVVGLMLTTLLSANTGIITKLANGLTGETINFYSTPNAWRFILPAVSVWKGLGYTSLIYYASLMGIDKEIFEAAEIDGASKLKCIRYISIPYMMPMICVMLIMNMGNIVRADFGLFYFVPRDVGILYPAIDVIDTYVYRALSQYGDFAMSSAVGFVQSIVGCILVVLTNKLANKYDSKYSLY